MITVGKEEGQSLFGLFVPGSACNGHLVLELDQYMVIKSCTREVRN